MGTAQPQRLRKPAYAAQLSQHVGMPAMQINVEAHIGKDAWRRAKQHLWWGSNGNSIVVALDNETTVTDYDFTCLHGLCLVLDARDCSYQTAVDCATRMCQHGAHSVCLFHPWARSEHGFVGWQIFRCALWANP